MVDREQAILERAREISQVTPEERAELEARRKANRLDEIMNMTVTKEAPLMVRKVQENALRSKPTNRPETEQEIVDRMKAHGQNLVVEIIRAARAESTPSGQLRAAISSLVVEIVLVSIANQIKRAELERRIEALEKEAKPRHRVKAISERIA